MKVSEAIQTNVDEGMAHLIKACNVMGGNDEFVEAIAKHLIKEHRTLQQSFVRGMLAGLKRYGTDSAQSTDLRNEAAVQACQDLPDTYLPYV